MHTHPHAHTNNDIIKERKRQQVRIAVGVPLLRRRQFIYLTLESQLRMICAVSTDIREMGTDEAWKVGFQQHSPHTQL